jgi:haloalkane dehalogenase
MIGSFYGIFTKWIRVGGNVRVSRSDIEKADWFKSDEYPFTSKYIDLSSGKLHYIDEGEGEAIVFVHGTPSWSYQTRRKTRPFRAEI